MSMRRRIGQVHYGASRDVVSLRGYIDGLTMSNDDASPGDDVNIAAGICRDSTDTVTIANTDITKQIDAIWDTGDDAGGMPNGLLAASTWYRVFLIRDSAGNVDAGFDTSATAANLIVDHTGSGGGDASGYTFYRQVGWVLTDATPEVVGFKQVGDWFFWEDPPLDADVSNLDTTHTPTVSVPVDCMGIFNVYVDEDLGSQPGAVDLAYASSTYVDDEDPSFNPGGGAARALGNIREGDTVDTTQVFVLVDASHQIRIRCDDPGGVGDNCGYRLMTVGYVDSRGRNA